MHVRYEKRGYWRSPTGIVGSRAERDRSCGRFRSSGLDLPLRQAFALQHGGAPCHGDIIFLPAAPAGNPGYQAVGVVVPFEDKHPAETRSIEKLVALVTADMERVNAMILSRTGSEVTMIPGSRKSSDRIRRQAAAADADPGDRRPVGLCRAKATSSSPPASSSCTPRPSSTTTWWTRATCGAARSRRASNGATRRACWSAISCSARPSR